MSDRVNQEELFSEIHRIVEIDDTLLRKIFNTLPKIVANGLKKDKQVKIPGLCSFSPKSLNACVLKIRGEEVHVPARKSILVRPTSGLLTLIK